VRRAGRRRAVAAARQRARACAIIALLLFAPVSHASASLEQPQGATIIIAGRLDQPVDATSATLQGVRTAQGLIPWWQVAEVRGTIAQEPDGAITIGRRAWRALTRLERGDLVLAEPELEELAKAYPDAGPTSEAIFAGLLTCKLERGARAAALGPWLKLVGASEQTETTDSSIRWPSWMSEALDPSTRLVPALPPIWIGNAAFALAGIGSWSGLGTSTDPTSRAGSLAALYTLAAKFESQTADSAPDATITIEDHLLIPATDSGVSLVQDIVLSRVGTATMRRERRASLEKRLAEAQPAWREQWIRIAIGRSLLREDDDESVLRGVVHLLQVPARGSAADPYLAGVALAESAVALAATGRVDEGTRLRREFLDGSRGHPATAWEAIRVWPPKPRTHTNARGDDIQPDAATNNGTLSDNVNDDGPKNNGVNNEGAGTIPAPRSP
jgi:hypothetical protein